VPARGACLEVHRGAEAGARSAASGRAARRSALALLAGRDEADPLPQDLLFVAARDEPLPAGVRQDRERLLQDARVVRIRMSTCNARSAPVSP
jgi:hypothetical protein